jgi:hypothetical protein
MHPPQELTRLQFQRGHWFYTHRTAAESDAGAEPSPFSALDGNDGPKPEIGNQIKITNGRGGERQALVTTHCRRR